MTCTLDLYNVTCTLDPADQHGPTGYNTGIFFRQSQVQYCVLCTQYCVQYLSVQLQPLLG